MAIKGTLFKAGGYYGRYTAITKILLGIILVIIGIVFVIMSIIKAEDGADILLLGIIIGLGMLIGGLFNIINGIIIWKRSASLVQGKFM